MGEMREILFRGKAKHSNRWAFGYYVVTLNGVHFIKNDNFNEVIPETVGQYTGLTDKNGTKIFEGDILHAAQGDFVVRWSESICSFVAGEKEKMQPCMNSGTMKHCEVIGNIHDNPELLE